MTTAITIDSTLIGAVIGAVTAIITACTTVIWTVISNSNLERTKLLQAKREEVLSLCEEMNEIISLKHFDTLGDSYAISAVTVDNAIKDIRSLASIERKANKIITINSIYFPKTQVDCENMTRKVMVFYSSVASMKSVISIFNHEESNKHYDTFKVKERYTEAKDLISNYKKNIISLDI
ncbi:hypothetical protein SerAS12_4076 [Serratia sp. AS12]|uniref:hypothetical protein n=1 Tax=Serratia TaxID=613 RepID=UPI00020EA028|nr:MULTISPECIES: hypothetical protein [Serratia]AEF47174.1 hypothetical protein SerAS9_4075 [Serratia plymuthica AS9]AEF52126.1 hypothetical protein SerAS12_4076 [Serratia sp. AS12]AEG29833.1 hypothetical protein SerAS13_4076 [Serratia sp. AS13]UTN95860.1 hypothetical protein NLX81_20740 [Serratia plymuthica]